jgi:hypothetical protein
MRRLSKGLRESLAESGVLAHALTKGELREAEVIAAFRAHIPSRYDLSSGIVVNATGKQSKQQDLIVSDNHVSPPFITGAGIGVHPVETVHGTVEIKSAATAANVVDGVAKAASVAQLLPSEPRAITSVTPGRVAFGQTASKPFSGIICLATRDSLSTVAAAYAEANLALPVENRCWCLLILGQAIVAWGTPDHQLQLNPLGAKRLWVVELGDDALLMFYAALLQGVSDYHAPTFDLNTYLSIEAPASPMHGMEVPDTGSPWTTPG